MLFQKITFNTKMNIQTINLSTAKYITRKTSNKRKWKMKLNWFIPKKIPKSQSNLFEINYVGLFEYIPYYENHPRKYTM